MDICRCNNSREGTLQTHQHKALQVTLHSGEAFIIDLTCAQFGHFDKPVMPIAVYLATRAEEIGPGNLFSHHRQVISEAYIADQPQYNAFRKASKETYETLNKFFKESYKAMPVSDMRTAKAGSYPIRQFSFLICAKIAFLEY